MKRVASLYLPDWSIDRLRRAGRIVARPDLGTAAVAALEAGGDGWRPGARWARIPNTSPARGGGPRSKSVVEGAYRERNARGAPPPPFAEEANGHPPRSGEELVVTTRREGSKVVIASVSPAARAIGLSPGMALTQARAQVPDIVLEPADPAGDRADLTRLALAAARRWSPLTALSGDDGLLLDITGTAHLFGGEARMARRIVRLLARLGFTARIAIADSAGAAWALARFGRAEGGITLCPTGTQEAALAACRSPRCARNPPRSNCCGGWGSSVSVSSPRCRARRSPGGLARRWSRGSIRRWGSVTSRSPPSSRSRRSPLHSDSPSRSPPPRRSNIGSAC